MTRAWQLQVLGGAQLSGETSFVLERKAAVLLTYLALEGPTSRAQVAELLWPGTREAAARNNLVHLLRKLRGFAGADLVRGGEVLSLVGSVAVDALEARDLFMRGEHDHFVRAQGEVLQGLTYDDCPDLDDWVLAERERWREWRAQACRAEVRRLEQEGQYEEALVPGTRLLDLDPVSEDAWRSLMRLHYLRGDRPAALRAYLRCRETLRRELDVEPLPETVQLAREIDRGTVRVGAPAVRAPTLPLAVLRPPTLVGREREWALLEQAWQAGQMIYIRGEPGSGKTRLAQEFAASKGETIVFPGRPGDASVPGASSARNFRILRERCPSAELEPWVRREMSRYLPELALPGETPPPLTSDTDLVRFRQAMLEFYASHVGEAVVTIADDLQFYDETSEQDGVFMFASMYPLGPENRITRILGVFRRGEVSEAVQRSQARLVEQGVAVIVDVEPLEGSSADALMNEVGVPQNAELRSKLTRFAGGNPLFLLETVKHLIESGQLHENFPDRLPRSEKVWQLIRRRLARLSSGATQAARAAAVLQSDFDPEQVAEVLGAPLLDIAHAWEELEAAQVMNGHRFSHDLVYEAVSGAIPTTVRQLLHRSAARTLERWAAPAARVAGHWHEGGKAETAAPWLLRAAQEAQDNYQLVEAAKFCTQAAEAFEAIRDQTGAARAWAQHRELFVRLAGLKEGASA